MKSPWMLQQTDSFLILFLPLRVAYPPTESGIGGWSWPTSPEDVERVEEKKWAAN